MTHHDKTDKDDQRQGCSRARLGADQVDMPGLDGKDLDQDVDDTVKQAAGKEPVPSGSTPNPD